MLHIHYSGNLDDWQWSHLSNVSGDIPIGRNLHCAEFIDERNLLIFGGSTIGSKVTKVPL
jgi:hypothetical protein